MKNWQKLMKTNEYDILLRINARLESLEPSVCVMDLLENRSGIGDCPVNVKDCEDCIAQWLNKEADK